MKEQDLVIDMYYSLKSILKEESEYSIMCFDWELNIVILLFIYKGGYYVKRNLR